jgi:lipase ATG15
VIAAARQRGTPPYTHPSSWTVDTISGPDITDKETVVHLAEMAANAYDFNETDPDWSDMGERFNRSVDFGWQGDGLRGHVYADETNSTIVIGIKGTTPGSSGSCSPVLFCC